MKVRQDRPDLLHVQYTAPVGCPVPVVVSVHDVSFLEHPEYFTRLRARQLQWTVRRTVKRAAKILTVSEFSRASILKVYGDLTEDKVVVVLERRRVRNSGQSRGTAPPPPCASDFRMAAPFILSVGDLQPRKNQIGLIRAFARLVRALPAVQAQTGAGGKGNLVRRSGAQCRSRFGRGRPDTFPGFVSDSDLLQLYNACDLFVFPSFYEGFGLPALEAMACGRTPETLPKPLDSF